MRKQFIIFITILTLPFVHVAAQQDPVSAFLKKWENSKNYLLQIVEAMPEDKYDYKPSERQMTFAEQLNHIQQNMNWLGSTYFSAPKTKTSIKSNSKEQILNIIKSAFNTVYNAVKGTSDKELKETVDFFAGPKTKLQILNLLQDHVTHHRGQLIVYLNLNEINPPRYVGW